MVFLFLGVVFVIFFILNVFMWGEKLFGVVFFIMMFVLVFFWFGILVFFVFVGSYFGFKKFVMEFLVKMNKILW